MMKYWIAVNFLSMTVGGWMWGVFQDQSHLELKSEVEDKFFYLSHISQEEIQQFVDHPSSILVCSEGTLCPCIIF